MCAKLDSNASENDADRPIDEKGRDEQEDIAYPEPPEELQPGSRNWRKLLLYFGPGAIVASLTLGSGETFFAPRGGALFGLSILWTVIFAGIVKGLMLYSGVRYRTLTSENIMSRWAKFPGPRGWFSMLVGLIALVVFPPWTSGLASIIGQVTAWSIGIPVNGTNTAIIGTLMIFITFGLVVIGGYDYVERIQVLIVAFLSVTIAILAIAVTPSLGGVAAGLIPTIPTNYPSFVQQNYPGIAARPVWLEVVTYMGVVGGGISDYLGYTGFSAKQRNWGMFSRSNSEDVENLMRRLDPGETAPIDTDENNLTRGFSWLKAPQVDVGISFAAITFFTAAAMILGAVTLHEAQLVPSQFKLFRFQSSWFTDIYPGLAVLWQIGVFTAIFGTMYSMWEGYAWTWLMSFRPFSSRIREIERNSLNTARTLVFLYGGGLGLVLLWTDISAVALLTPASIFGGVFGCGLWCFGMVWADKTSLPSEFQGNLLYYGALVVSGLFLLFAGSISILQYIGLLTL